MRQKSSSQVVVPVSLSEGETLADSGLVDLDGLDTGGLEVLDLVPQSESELLALDLTRNVGSGERPVEDGDGTGQHSLHGALGERGGVGGPSNGHGCEQGRNSGQQRHR